jgi:hypothetical protein
MEESMSLLCFPIGPKLVQVLKEVGRSWAFTFSAAHALGEGQEKAKGRNQAAQRKCVVVNVCVYVFTHGSINAYVL